MLALPHRGRPGDLTVARTITLTRPLDDAVTDFAGLIEEYFAVADYRNVP